jgi:hypothetical protein
MNDLATRMLKLLLACAMTAGCGTSVEVDSQVSVVEDPAPQQTATSVPASELPAEIREDSQAKEDVDEPSPSTPEAVYTRPRMIVSAGDVLDITFDDLELEMEKGAEFESEMLTPKIEDLHGKRVILRGFILAASVFTQRGIKQFVLIRDNQQCCFGPGAYIYHNVQVDMEEGQTANFTIRPVTAAGLFSIKPWYGPDGKCYSVYHLKASRVK